MAPTQEETPFYIRTQGGNTFYVETLAEALEQFVGEDGYRLSLEAGGNLVTFRRLDPWEAEALLPEGKASVAVVSWVKTT